MDYQFPSSSKTYLCVSMHIWDRQFETYYEKSNKYSSVIKCLSPEIVCLANKSVLY